MSGETTLVSSKQPAPSRLKLWTGILAVYFILLASTGYVAFLGRDHSPALDQGPGRMAASLSDERTRSVVMNALEQESAEYERRTALAHQAFNVILGALLGFLSASAVFGIGRGTDVLDVQYTS